MRAAWSRVEDDNDLSVVLKVKTYLQISLHNEQGEDVQEFLTPLESDIANSYCEYVVISRTFEVVVMLPKLCAHENTNTHTHTHTHAEQLYASSSLHCRQTAPTTATQNGIACGNTLLYFSLVIWCFLSRSVRAPQKDQKNRKKIIKNNSESPKLTAFSSFLS